MVAESVRLNSSLLIFPLRRIRKDKLRAQGEDDGFVPLIEGEDNGNVAQFLPPRDPLGIGSGPAIQGLCPSGPPLSVVAVKLLGAAVLDENFHR